MSARNFGPPSLEEPELPDAPPFPITVEARSSLIFSMWYADGTSSGTSWWTFWKEWAFFISRELKQTTPTLSLGEDIILFFIMRSATSSAMRRPDAFSSSSSSSSLPFSCPPPPPLDSGGSRTMRGWTSMRKMTLSRTFSKAWRAAASSEVSSSESSAHGLATVIENETRARASYTIIRTN